jgi:hypothetical protein
MSTTFPSFDPGTAPSLLDSSEAKKVKAFIEAFNDIKIVRGKEQDAVRISDRNVVINLQDPDPATEPDAIEVVGSDGKINVVPKHSTWTTPTAYPTALRVVAGGRTISIDSNGVAVQGAGSNYVSINDDGVTVSDGSSGGITMVAGEGVHVFNAAGKDCYIQYSAITHNMGVKTISICSAGVTKSIDLIASDPY